MPASWLSVRPDPNFFTAVLCAAIEVTERKRLEEVLKQTNDNLEQKVRDRTLRLRQLTAELTKAEHTERRRIADILHEQLQQHLCGMKFRVAHLKADSSTPTITRWADRLVKELDESIQLTRTLTTDLHPPVLSHLGIRNAIEWLATDVRKKMGLSVIVRSAKHVPPISGEIKTFAFEAVRELLLNVVKHAQAKTAELRLGSSGKEQIRIEVKDTGIGFDPKHSAEAGSHFGLFRIQERAESFGGRLEVASQPDKGTSITLILPHRY
jgi:signal transduction histidine kinase